MLANHGKESGGVKTGARTGQKIASTQTSPSDFLQIQDAMASFANTAQAPAAKLASRVALATAHAHCSIDTFVEVQF